VVTDRTLISDMFRAQELVDKVRLFINEARWDGSTITQSSFNDPENATRTAEDPRLMTMIRDAFDVVDPDKRHDALAKVYPELQAEHYLLSMGHANLPWGGQQSHRRVAALAGSGFLQRPLDYPAGRVEIPR
jgi:hypothetical protein